MVPRGRPAAALVDDARRMAAELIVVGSRGHGTIESMLLGSVSAEVIDLAMTPVLVARGRRIDRVVLAWDTWTSASSAAELLSRWPIFARSSVRVVSMADIEIPWRPDFPGAGSSEGAGGTMPGSTALIILLLSRDTKILSLLSQWPQGTQRWLHGHDRARLGVS